MRFYLTDEIYHDLDDSDCECFSFVSIDAHGPPVPCIYNGRTLLKPEAMWRHKKGGGYDNRPNNPQQYFRNYYHTKRAFKVKCEVCGCSVSKQHMPRHKRTLRCQLASRAVSLALAKASPTTEQDY